MKCHYSNGTLTACGMEASGLDSCDDWREVTCQLCKSAVKLSINNIKGRIPPVDFAHVFAESEIGELFTDPATERELREDGEEDMQYLICKRTGFIM